MQVKLKVLGGGHSGREIPVSVKQFLIGGQMNANCDQKANRSVAGIAL